MHNQEATKKYIETQLEIQAEIEKLQTTLDSHNAQAVNVHWGHVGDMAHILSQLKELNGEEDD
jgi:uncharacterized membrane-anchored protein YhcB (DUF1043 family)